jgi:UDP-GlcNAc:undecaprenyl-phosphate/decaprenyl-phosphate GlcNAc-1-phosphate transferase
MSKSIRDYIMFDRLHLVAPFAAFLIGVCALRTVRRIAMAVGFVDNPDRWRKLHEAPIPLGGGLALWLATWSGWGISRLCSPADTGADGDAGWFAIGLAIASFVVLGLGVIDDRHGLRALQKLVGQVVAAVILVCFGLRIDAWSAFGVEANLGILAHPVAVCWIVLVVNAFNLVDGMDGFCGSLGLVAALGISFLAYRSGRVGDAILGLALAGALAAFLRDNLPPARVYLGDAGSMTLGLMVSALSVRACSDGSSNAVSLPPLVALLTLPLLDVVTAIGRRSITGRSVFTPDRGHIHHCLRSRLGSTVAALGAAVGLATLGAGGAALVKVNGLGDLASCLAIVISVGLLVGTNTFGRSELRLLRFRIRTALTPLLTGGAVRQGAIKQACHLHGIRDWAGVWDALIHKVEDGGVWRIELAIDMAAAGEVYHGLWILPVASGNDQCWSVVHNLYAGGVPAGVLQVAGSSDASQSHHLAKVEELVRMLEGQLGSDVPPSSPCVVPLPSCVPMSAPLT